MLEADSFNILTTSNSNTLGVLGIFPPKKTKVASSIRNRSQRCFFIALLGYFKSKPVMLNPCFGDVQDDLRFIAREQLPGPGLLRFTLNQRQKDRLYLKLFELIDYEKWCDNTLRKEILSGKRAHSCVNPTLQVTRGMAYGDFCLFRRENPQYPIH